MLSNFKLSSIPLALRLLGTAVVTASAAHAWAQDATASAEAAIEPTPTVFRLTDETWKLPGTERMGMLGATALFRVNDHFQLGGATYGATRGNRGGFITLGAAGELDYPITTQLSAHGGLFVGGGGGRGGRQLAGGGLMLRSHLGLSYDLGDLGRLGAGVAHVRFPSGVIRSTQPYLQYEYDFHSLMGPAGQARSAKPGSTAQISTRGQEFAAVVRDLRFGSNVVRDDGTAQSRSLQLAGVEWLQYQDERWFWKVEAEGAAAGQNSGYMQVLFGGGYRLPLGSSSALKLHASAGPAGGGAADTGGGVLVDVGASFQTRVTRSSAVEVGLAYVQAPSRSFKAASLGVKWVQLLDAPIVGGATVPASSLAGLDMRGMRVRVVQQTYIKGSPDWRCCFANLNVQNMGVQLDFMSGSNADSLRWFATGQGIAAVGGQAGAYMTGLWGLGAQKNWSPRFFTEAEALVGAAGGGGLAVGGGLLVQANASVGYRFNKSLAGMVTVGYAAAPRGAFRAKVVGASLSYDFSTFSKP